MRLTSVAHSGPFDADVGQGDASGAQRDAAALRQSRPERAQGGGQGRVDQGPALLDPPPTLRPDDALRAPRCGLPPQGLRLHGGRAREEGPSQQRHRPLAPLPRPPQTISRGRRRCSRGRPGQRLAWYQPHELHSNLSLVSFSSFLIAFRSLFVFVLGSSFFTAIDRR